MSNDVYFIFHNINANFFKFGVNNMHRAPQGAPIGVFPKFQLWCQVSITLPYYLQRYY